MENVLQVWLDGPIALVAIAGPSTVRLIDAVRLDVKRALETYTVGLIPITGVSRPFSVFSD
jgi:hypothetical protein